MVHCNDILSGLQFRRDFWLIRSIREEAIDELIFFGLSLSNKDEQRPNLRCRRSPNKNPIFFLKAKRGERREVISGLMITPILIVDIDAFKHEQLLKVPPNIALTNQERLIRFKMPIYLEFLRWLHFLPNRIVQWVFAIPTWNLTLADQFVYRFGLFLTFWGYAVMVDLNR